MVYCQKNLNAFTTNSFGLPYGERMITFRFNTFGVLRKKVFT
jgi:hypothetical protein